MLNSKLLLLAAVILSTSTTASASEGDIWVNLHIGSRHSGSGYYNHDTHVYHDWNETNYGAGLEYEETANLSFCVGAYDNSVNALSVYGGISVHTSYDEMLGVGVSGGFVTGYEKLYGQPYSGMVLPTVFFNAGRARVEVSYIPKTSKELDSLWTLSVGFNFK